MTRVLFDARALSHPALAGRGIGRYARSLLEALGQRDVVAIRGSGRWSGASEARNHLGLRRDTHGAHLLHTPAIDFAPLRSRIPVVVTLHDLVPLKQPERYLRTGFRHRLRYAAVKRAARVIVPSRAVADDAQRLLAIAPERIAVIPEAPAPVFRPMAGAAARIARLGLPERFLLWVGGLDPPDPRKNVEALATAVAARDDLPLVLAGRPGPDAERLAVPGRVVLAGPLGDEDLASVYSAAEALVFASSDEGFGLPPVEALACATPVAAFRIPALAETLSDADGVELVTEGDFPALVDAAHALAGTPASAPARTWNDVASETWDVYEVARTAG